MRSFCFKIAEIVFSIETEIPLRDFGETYKPFLSKGEREDVSLRLHLGQVPNLNLDNSERFLRLGAWNLCLSGGKWILTLSSNHSESSTLAILAQDFRTGDVYYQLSKPESELLPQILAHPLHQILMVSVLSQGRGSMFHASGIDDKGDGYLFLGKSTHGKSTLANLWKEGRILDDDRVIVRGKGGRFWMYGTPWHSIPDRASPSGLPVKSIFFLRKGGENLAVRKVGIEALSMVLQRCFLPFWDGGGVEYVLSLCGRLAERVPCYELTFHRDGSVVDYVRNLSG